MNQCIVQLNKSDSQSTSRARIINFFIKNGLTPTQACGICGNFEGESGFNTTADGDGILHSFGLAQWNGSRKANLNKLAEKYNVDKSDFNFQLEFAWYELNGSYSFILTHFRNNPNLSISECTEYFCDKYEVPNERYKRLPERIQFANEAYILYQNSTKGDCNAVNINSNIDTGIISDIGTSSSSASTTSYTASSSSASTTSSDSVSVSINTEVLSDLNDICRRLLSGFVTAAGGIANISINPLTSEITVENTNTGNTEVVTPEESQDTGGTGNVVIDHSNVGKPVLIGDSWANGMSLVFPQKTNGNAIGLSGTFLAHDSRKFGKGASNQLKDYNVKENKPKYILCHSGFNGVKIIEQKWFEEVIKAADGIPIFIVNIPYTYHPTVKDTEVDKANQKGEDACKKYQNAYFVNIGKERMLEIKELTRTQSGDHFHLNPSGYKKLFEYIVDEVRTSYRYDLITGRKI